MTARLAPAFAVALAVAAAGLVAGCPLPQPLPDYPPGTVTPPRILTASATRPAESIIAVPAGCPTPPTYDLGARIFYPSNVTVEARWFVDYRSDVPERYTPRNTVREVPADPDPDVLERTVPPFHFSPYGYSVPEELRLPPGTERDDPHVVHVVELVVSNGFDPDPGVPEPNRTPAVTEGGARFEIQTFRWVFVNVEPPPGCVPDSPGCCP